MKENQLIFLVSQPRAGSTALQIQMAANPSIKTISEPWILLPLLGLHKENFLSAVYNHELYRKTQREYLNEIGDIKYKKTLKKFILSQYRNFINENEFFLDKTPRYYEILNEIYSLFPKAKYIILKRHPIDVLKSIIQTWCQNDLNNLDVYARDIIYAPKAILDFETKYKDINNLHVVKYEDIIKDADTEINKIFSFLEVTQETSVVKDVAELLKGSFGDHKNARTRSNIELIGKSWSNLAQIENVKYKRIARGYYDFLGDEFLFKYGGYTCENYRFTITGRSIIKKLQITAQNNIKY